MVDDTAKSTAVPKGGKSRREPPTIDLAADAVVEESPVPPAPDPSETIVMTVETGTVASSLAAAADRPPLPDKATIAGDGQAATPEPSEPAPAEPEQAVMPPPRRQRSLAAPVAIAGLLGGAAGALGALFLSGLFTPADTASERIAILERSIEAVRVTAAGRADVQALDKRIVEIAARPAPTPAGADPEVLAGVARRIEAAEAALKAFDPTALKAGADAAARTSALDGRLASVEKAVTAARGDNAARAVVAGNLVRALDAGSPYAAEIQALSGLGADQGRLAALSTGAAKGLPTAAALAREFNGLAARVLSEAASSDGGFLDRLASSALQVVRVRPVGDTGGATPTAIVSRIEAALARGALGDALAAWKTLPEPSRRASEAWGRSLEARVTAETAARSLLSEAIATLGGRTQ